MSKNHSKTNKAHRRTTFKKHSKSYAKVYAPYLPALLILGLSVWTLLSTSFNKQEVLSVSNSQTIEKLLESTNSKRQESGSPALKLNPSLNSAAQAKADDMVLKNYWSHISPNGEEPWVFFEKANYNYLKASENLAYGFKSSDSTVNGWMNSPSHKQTMLDKNIQEVGFGIAKSNDFLGQGPETVVVGFYAKPSSLAGTGNVLESTDFGTNKKVSFAETLGAWGNPSLNFVLGLILGVGIMYLCVKHGLGLRRKLKQGEKFIVKHPAIDLTVIALVVLSLVLIKTSGHIY
ncbi:hypothetical protein HZB74_02360 [Candidatus Saccharibacteria bacterium]|nr:hypothetical protein [Candidatus Saccharibacteria bacterium]